jgi:hypothetical protein
MPEIEQRRHGKVNLEINGVSWAEWWVISLVGGFGLRAGDVLMIDWPAGCFAFLVVTAQK